MILKRGNPYCCCFDSDLKNAKKVERELAKFLVKHLAVMPSGVYRTQGKDDRYDLVFVFKNNSVSIEVKNDFKCVSTGNVAVEYANTKGHSGIRTTKADYYLYKIQHLWWTRMWYGEWGYYLISVDDLKKQIENGLFFRNAPYGGDNEETSNYLFTLKFVQDTWDRIDGACKSSIPVSFRSGKCFIG